MVLKATLTLTTIENTLVEGVIRCDRDGLLYTSIPQNGNWSATVDGAPAEIALVGDAMVGVYLTEGLHEVRFSYHNAAFSLGWKISLVCVGVFLLLVHNSVRPAGRFSGRKKRPGKFEH